MKKQKILKNLILKKKSIKKKKKFKYRKSMLLKKKYTKIFWHTIQDAKFVKKLFKIHFLHRKFYISKHLRKESSQIMLKFFIFNFYCKDFLKKLLGLFFKNGKKQLIYTKFLTVFLLIKKFWKKSLLNFFYICYLNILPIFFMRNKHMGKTLFKLPWVYTNRDVIKYNKLTIIWIKKSLDIRKEKTFTFKLFSELKDIYMNKGLTVKQKKNLYFDLYESRSTLRFLRFLKW